MGMPSTLKVVRQSVRLPNGVAKKVRFLAKRRRLSANSVLIGLVEEGLAAQERKEKALFELTERYRSATDPQEKALLGDQLGRMVFGE
jgi:hypothetical protein